MPKPKQARGPAAIGAALVAGSLSLGACGVATNRGDDTMTMQGNPDMTAAAATDMAGQKPHDMAGQKPADMTPTGPVDMMTTPLTGSVGPTGGSVSRLYFGFSGDARPVNCNEHTDYPTAILDSIFTRLESANVQFAMDLGDHMFVCQNGTQQEATAQMNLYMTSAKKLSKTTFLTMGNHDCVSMTNTNYCGVDGFTTVNYTAFLAALASEKIGGSLPYYEFDVNTQNGLASFIVIADNAWSTTEQTWLQNAFTTADANAKYIFIFRHHPLDNTDWPAFPTITQMIGTVQHKTMVFTGHDHEFRVDTYNDKTGRTAIIGNAGAPLTTNFTWYGYGTVEQLQTGNLAVRVFDQSTGNQMVAYQVAPQ